MTNANLIADLINGRKLENPVQLDMDQALLLEIAKHLKVIRSSVGTLAFLAIVGVVLGVLGLIF